jgi:apolipoprotein N-acyltransferase
MAMRFLLFSFLAGLAAACGFQPLGLWPLTLAAVAALLWLVESAPNLRGALARGWWFGVGYFVLGLNWIATAFTYQSEMPPSLGWVAVVLLSLFLAVYPTAAAGLAWRLTPRRADPLRFVLVFAAAWIVTEWLRAGLFTGFAWNPLGVVWLDAWGVAGLSRYIGTYGLSGLAVLAGGAVLLLAKRRWWAGSAIALPILASALLFYPIRFTEPSGNRIAIRIVQPNIGQQEKWQEGFEREGKARLGRLSAGDRRAPRLLLWPEAAVTEPLENGLADVGYRIAAARLRKEVAAMLAPGDLLLTGGVTWRSAGGVEISSATNSVFAIDPAGRILGRYDKAHLVPYGEYLPMRPLLSALGLSRLAPGDVDFDSGPGPRTLDLPLAGKVGLQVCYEIIFSGEVADRRDRPAVIFNPSNDAWFGRWGPPQHLAQARLRAWEEGLPVLRSTPTGISAVIDAKGQLLRSLPWQRQGVIDTILPLPDPPTPFARFGNLLPLLFALLLVALAIAVRRKAR